MLGSSAAPTGSYTSAEETANISQRHPWWLEKRAKKFHMTRHYSNLGGASDWLNQIFNQSEALPRSR